MKGSRDLDSPTEQVILGEVLGEKACEQCA